MALHLIGTHMSKDQQLATQEFNISSFPIYSIVNCYIFLCKYINAYYEPNQTPWYVCLIECWPHTELLSQPQSYFVMKYFLKLHNS